MIRGELDRAEDVILVDRRRLGPDPDGIPEEAAWSGIRFGRGEIGAAIEVMESFLASPYALTLGSTPAQWPLPDDPVVNTWSILGLARWIAAAPGPAWDAFDHAFARAERLDFPHGPFCRAYILLIRLLVDELAGRTDEAVAAVEEMKAISERHGFALFGMCSTLHGALVAASTDPVAGTVALEAAFEHFRLLGMDLWNPWGFTVLGHTLLRSGDHDGALRCVDTATAEAARTGAHFWTAETHRVRGLARLAQADPGGRQDLLAAADLAARQGARLFELRANLDLVNHGAENRRDALRDLLHRIGPVDSLPEAAAARRLLGIRLNDQSACHEDSVGTVSDINVKDVIVRFWTSVHEGVFRATDGRTAQPGARDASRATDDRGPAQRGAEDGDAHGPGVGHRLPGGRGLQRRGSPPPRLVSQPAGRPGRVGHDGRRTRGRPGPGRRRPRSGPNCGPASSLPIPATASTRPRRPVRSVW